MRINCYKIKFLYKLQIIRMEVFLLKAAIYSRKSKFTEEGESIENQINMCIDYDKKFTWNY